MIKYTEQLPQAEMNTEPESSNTNTGTIGQELAAMIAEMTSTREDVEGIATRFKIYTHALALCSLLFLCLYQTPFTQSTTHLYQATTFTAIACMYWYCTRVQVKALQIEWQITRKLSSPVMAAGNIDPKVNMPSLNELQDELKSFTVSRGMHDWQQGILSTTFDTTFISRAQFTIIPLLATDIVTAFPYCIIMWGLFIPTWSKLKFVKKTMKLERQKMDEYESTLQEAQAQLLAEATGK